MADALLTVSGGGAIIKGTMRKLGLLAEKSMTGASYKALINKVDDAILPATEKAELFKIIPDDATINVGKKFVKLPVEEKIAKLPVI